MAVEDGFGALARPMLWRLPQGLVFKCLAGDADAF
jgi:hypothetical protein